MGRTIDQIRASKLPSNMMQFAARGALQVPAAENIEILVHDQQRRQGAEPKRDTEQMNADEYLRQHVGPQRMRMPNPGE